MMWPLLAAGIAGGIGLVALVVAVRTARRGSEQMKGRTTALRCSRCGIDWPHDVGDYGQCPVCLEPTDVIAGKGVDPLDGREARSIKLHHEFERFYAARESKRAA